MILSGSYVLFMDPGKTHLGRDRSCFKVSLETMKRYVDFISWCALNITFMISGFSLHTSLYYMATMVLIIQWMNIMGFAFPACIFF
jgi:hypothetical protein